MSSQLAIISLDQRVSDTHPYRIWYGLLSFQESVLIKEPFIPTRGMVKTSDYNSQEKGRHLAVIKKNTIALI